jgi:hypothetical protein
MPIVQTISSRILRQFHGIRDQHPAICTILRSKPHASLEMLPGRVEGGGQEPVVAMTLSGSYPRSPVTLGFHITIGNGRIPGLDIVA